MHQRNLNPIGGGVKRNICHNDVFDEIISLQNLFSAWREFSRGKLKKPDVLGFKLNLEDNLFSLYYELKDKYWRHSHYTAFNVCDPKLRRIHKACVRDRVLHHALFRVLYPIFDKSFIFDSYSCRIGKGTYRAINRLNKFTHKLSRNNSKNIFALKCDIRKFFDSIDQDILLNLISRRTKDNNALWLIETIIKSFQKEPNKGLPLGNVTSQLFANICLNELDQFVKHKLKIKYYLRYCDDFIVLSEDEYFLKNTANAIGEFLEESLKLNLHPGKISIRKYHQGIDFLGYVVLPGYRVLRTKTKRRMLEKIKRNFFLLEKKMISKKFFSQSLKSYFGVLSHCEGYKIGKIIEKITSP